MKLLGYLFYFLGIVSGAWLIISAFATWVYFWGVPGAIFTVFLFPIAIIGQPLIQCFAYETPIFLLNYLDLALCVGFFIIGSWLVKNSENRAESRQRRIEDEEFKNYVVFNYHKERESATLEKQHELDRFINRWWELINKGWRPRQAYYWLLEHEPIQTT